MLAGALAVLTLIAAVVLAVRAGGQSSAGAGSAGETTTPSAPATIELVAADLVGRPVQEVQAELVARGLQVSVVPVETGEVPAGQVLSVEPVAGLAPDAVVTLTYAVPPVPVPVVPEAPPAPEVSDQGDNRGNGNGDDGNDKGKDKGKDKEDKDDD
jgi:serine/threonine-protein kinase